MGHPAGERGGGAGPRRRSEVQERGARARIGSCRIYRGGGHGIEELVRGTGRGGRTAGGEVERWEEEMQALGGAGRRREPGAAGEVVRVLEDEGDGEGCGGEERVARKKR